MACVGVYGEARSEVQPESRRREKRKEVRRALKAMKNNNEPPKLVVSTKESTQNVGDSVMDNLKTILDSKGKDGKSLISQVTFDLIIGRDNSEVLKNSAKVDKDGRLILNGIQLEVERVENLWVEGFEKPINMMPYLIAFNCTMSNMVNMLFDSLEPHYGAKVTKNCNFTLNGIKNTLLGIYGCKKDELEYRVYQDILSTIGDPKYKELSLFRGISVTEYNEYLPYYMALSKHPKYFYATAYSCVSFLERNTFMSEDDESAVRSSFSSMQGFSYNENRIMYGLGELQYGWFQYINGVCQAKEMTPETDIRIRAECLSNIDKALLMYLNGKRTFEHLMSGYKKDISHIESSLKRLLIKASTGKTISDDECKTLNMLDCRNELSNVYKFTPEAALSAILIKNRTSIARYAEIERIKNLKSAQEMAGFKSELAEVNKQIREIEKNASNKSVREESEYAELERRSSEAEQALEDTKTLLSMEKEEVKQLKAYNSDIENEARTFMEELSKLKKVLEVYAITDDDIESVLQTSATLAEEEQAENQDELEDKIKALNEYKIAICGASSDFVARLKEHGLKVDGHIDKITRKDTTYDIYVYMCERISHTMVWQLEKLATSQNAMQCYVHTLNVKNTIKEIYKTLEN